MDESYSKHSRLEHVFAIVRIDLDAAHAWENRVTVTKIVRTEEAATREVDRLNRLNSGKGYLYFHQITRLELLSEKKLPK